MSEVSAVLHATAVVLANSPTAIHLHEQRDRLLSALSASDASLTLDTAKAFLESIFKTVLTDLKGGDKLPGDFTPLFKALRDVLPFSQDNDTSKRLHKIAAAIVHNLGELRNAHGAASHGNDGYYVCPAGPDELRFLAQLTDSLGALTLSRHRNQSDPSIASRLHYEDHEGFNDFWDMQYDGYEMPFSSRESFVISASKLLFENDREGYREALLQFIQSETEDSDEE